MYDIDKICKYFGPALRKIRCDTGQTQKDAARLCGVSQSIFSQYESEGFKGRNFLPNIHTLLKICNGLEVSTEELLRTAEQWRES